MTQIPDHYEIYYADKLWNSLPAIYRALDTDNFSSNGPLREMVNRIGAQAAILRRSIDRVWEDQSIETCDGWVIPYIGDLVATNLVANLDARAQRIDVYKTIYYRRRKGTPALLEELAFDITGWNAKVIEFFRRMGRTRHGLDPQIGQPVTAGDGIATLQIAEGIVGPLTGTPVGGTANLRNVYGASKAGSAFDEFFHTADFRLGQGMAGWHNIPRLGVFLWRLYSLGVPPTTPVAVAGSANCFTFDPTGRNVPLFAAARESDQYGDNWVPPAEEQLPGPISQTLYNTNVEASPADVAVELYPDSLQVLPTPVPLTDDEYIPANEVCVWPELGRFMYCGSPPLGSPPVGSPPLGSPPVGSPPVGSPPIESPPVESPPVESPPIGSPPTGSPPVGLWTTYHYGFSSEIGAGPYDRRLVRTAPPIPNPQVSVSGGSNALTTSGAIPSAGTLTIADSLTYDGAGNVCVSAASGLTICAADEQRPLVRLLPASPPGPASEWVIKGEGESCLVLDGLFISGGDVVICGSFQSVTITCCTLDPGTAADSAASSPPGNFAVSADGRPLAPTRLWIEASVETLTIAYSITGPVQTRNGGQIQTLNVNDSILQAIPGSAAGDELQSPLSPPAGAADAALLLDDGDVCLSRCTVLGHVIVHRLRASECILADLATVDDTQHGCVRFTAWSQGSILPAQYESVQIPAQAAIFTSTDFGQPGYCQLLATVDQAIEPGSATATQNTISAGSQDGSEMGAFAREKNPIKERGLLIKYQEYMPFGLVPVVVYVT